MLYDPSKEFKTADELGLFEEQRYWLGETLRYMESGVFSHKTYNQDGLMFRMNDWITAHDDCGTACCIGGTACMLADKPQLFNTFPGSYPVTLEKLFSLWTEKGTEVSVERGAAQLRKFLTTGECPWYWADRPV